jgi:hypothetical protein
MGWVQFTVAIVRLVSSIWVPQRGGRSAQAKTIGTSLFLSKPQGTQKRTESVCPFGECFREKG